MSSPRPTLMSTRRRAGVIAEPAPPLERGNAVERAYTLAEALRFGRGTERSFLCPHHGDSRPSASVNIIKKVYYCYTCHAHGNLSGEALLAEPDYLAMKLWVDRKLSQGTIYPETWLAQYDAGPVHPYWVHRVGEMAARVFR